MTRRRPEILALCFIVGLYAGMTRAAVVDREAPVGGQVRVDGKVIATVADRPVVIQLPGDDVRLIPKAAPATQPTTKPAEVEEEPATRPAPIPNGTLIVGDGLQKAIAASRKGDRLLLSGDVTQRIVGEVYVDHDLTIEGLQPAPVQLISKGGGQCGLVVRNGARVNLRNLVAFTDYQGTTSRTAYPATLIKYRSGGGDVINVRSERLDTLVKGEPGARDVLVERCETDAKHRGYGVWVDGDGWVIKDSRLRSVIEHPIRIGEDGNYKQLARNIQIVGCDLSRPLNAVKECLTIRKAENVLVERVRCYLGEPGQLSATAYALRLGYDDAREPKLRNVTLRDVTVGNGVVDVKRGNFGGNVVFERLRIEGNLPPVRQWEGDALWLNRLPVELRDATWNGKAVQ